MRKVLNAQEIIDSIETPAVKSWYQKYLAEAKLGVCGFVEEDTLLLDYISKRTALDGYSFDTKSGLYIKQLFPKKILERLGHTDLNIIFPRPVDWHYHKDVGEALHVISGRGRMIMQIKGEAMPRDAYMKSGSTFFVRQGDIHSFRPDKGDYLEMSLTCTGILDPEQEVCVTRFDKEPHWKEYYEDPEKK